MASEEDRFDIVGIGASTVDVLSRVDHLPAMDEVMQAREMVLQGGGPVSTALVTAARLGARTAMLDAIGDDWRGDQVRAGFHAEGVETRHLRIRPGATTATSCILVEATRGARSIVYAPGDAAELRPEEVPLEVIRRARSLHLNGRHLAACAAAIPVARAAGALISFDGGAGRHRPELAPLLEQVDLCVVAADFARRHTGLEDPHAAAEALLARGARIAVVTLGEAGSVAHSRAGEAFHQPAFRFPHIVDTTGCGDSYHGALLFALLRGEPLRQATALASAVAALNSQRLGGRAGLPTMAEAAALLASADGRQPTTSANTGK